MQAKPEHRALSVQGHHSQRETLTDLGDVNGVFLRTAPKPEVKTLRLIVQIDSIAVGPRNLVEGRQR